MGKAFAAAWWFLTLFAAGAFYLWCFGEYGLIDSLRNHTGADDILMTGMFSALTAFGAVVTFILGICSFREDI